MITIEPKKESLLFKLGTAFAHIRNMAKRIKVTPDYSNPDKIVLKGEFQVIDRPEFSGSPEIPAITEIKDTDPNSLTFGMIKRQGTDSVAAVPPTEATYKTQDFAQISIPCKDVMSYDPKQSHPDFIKAITEATEKGYELQLKSTI